MSNETEVRITRGTALAMAADQLLLLTANEPGEKVMALATLSQAWCALAAVMQPGETIITSKGLKTRVTRQI